MRCGRKLDGACTINRIGEWLKKQIYFFGNTHRKNNENYDEDNCPDTEDQAKFRNSAQAHSRARKKILSS